MDLFYSVNKSEYVLFIIFLSGALYFPICFLSFSSIIFRLNSEQYFKLRVTILYSFFGCQRSLGFRWFNGIIEHVLIVVFILENCLKTFLLILRREEIVRLGSHLV